MGLLQLAIWNNSKMKTKLGLREKAKMIVFGDADK